ncbi:MAG: EamA family transporter [Rhizobiales bacterium]|nr:EamA family transporter [Hyphomicrobiales bacterium]MBI3673283.1 EamA family transporter [Hyphomicrobiales bacterium]
MANSETRIGVNDWLLLTLLSVLWGGTYFFIAIAVKELPPFTIVFARVAVAALVLIPIHWLVEGPLPRSPSAWRRFLVMAVLNNIVPFSLIVTGQQYVASGLASIINATTPLFATIIMAGFGDERLIARKLAGILLGVLGVAILHGEAVVGGSGAAFGILLFLGAAASYGFAGLWAKRQLAGVAPLTLATCQLSCSAIVMAVLTATADRPWQLPLPSAPVWASLAGLAVLSTALAYIIFFKVLARSGPSNVLLVTLMIPLTAILLGHFLLGETLGYAELLGAAVIASSLLLIDGRVIAVLAHRSG